MIKLGRRLLSRLDSLETRRVDARPNRAVSIPDRTEHRRRSHMASETIGMGGLELGFLQSKEGTAGSLDVFEMTVQPNARMPVAHYHESWDETIYGIAGAST